MIRRDPTAARALRPARGAASRRAPRRRRPAHPPGPARLGRAHARPRGCAARDPRRGRRPVRPRLVRRVRARAHRRHRRDVDAARRRSSRRWPCPRATNVFTLQAGGARDAGRRDPVAQGRDRDHRPARRGPGRRDGARAAARVADRARRRTSSTARGGCSRRSARSRRRRPRPCPWSTTPAPASASLDVGATLDPVTLDARAPARVAHARRRRQRRPLAGAARSTTRTGSRCAPARRRGRRCSGSTRPTLRTTELVPGQVRLLRSLLAGREAGGRNGSSSPTTTAGPTCRVATPEPHEDPEAARRSPEADHRRPSHEPVAGASAATRPRPGGVW